MFKRITTALTIAACAAVVALTGTSPSSNTAAPISPAIEQVAFSNGNVIPAHYGSYGWWDNTSTYGTTYSEEQYQYADYPIPCNTVAADRSFIATLIYKQGDPIPPDSRVLDIRKGLKQAASIFGASSRKVLTTEAHVRSSLTPRYVTETNCEPRVTRLAIPAAIYDDYYETYKWMRTNGFNANNRMYLVFREGCWPGCDFGGQAINYGTAPLGNTSYITPDRNKNFFQQGGFGLITGLNFDADGGRTIAHEMVHLLGSAYRTGGANPNTPAHANECNELMCTGIGTTETFPGGFCGVKYGEPGYDFYTSYRASQRLDCNLNDYWAPFPAQTFDETYWAVSSSSYLWGNPQPVAGSFPATTPCTTTSCRTTADGTLVERIVAD